MPASPNSYSDPYWTDLAGRTEQKLELPPGLLVGVLTKGERSNADQVSEAGAKTPFQIIPATRDAAIKKWGIDPYLSPENAAEVAGNLLKDSLTRNKGNPVLAVSEYHGGTDRSNWGPRTKAYAKRVVGMSPDHPDAATAAPAAAGKAESTFDRVSKQIGFDAPPESAIANVLKAYQGGQMAPADAKAFEDDVNAGHIMLPRGATLGGTAAAEPAAGAGPMVLPAGVLDAYANGSMSAADKAELERDLKAGAIQLPPNAVLGQSSAIASIPQTARVDGTMPAPVVAPLPKADPSLVDRALGFGETGLTLATGMTTGALGMVGGGLAGAVGNLTGEQYGLPGGVEAGMAKGLASGTYMPSTETGQDLTESIGKAAMAVPVVAGLGMEMGAAGRAAAAGAARVGDAAAATVQRVRAAAPAIADRLERVLRRNPDPVPPAPTPGTLGSGGSAGTDMRNQRAELAAKVGIDPTEGQLTRDPNQLRFENETAKGEMGQPIRERYSDQNKGFEKHFDDLVDKTDAANVDPTAVGKAVDQVLRKELARDKTEVRVKYKAAENSPESAKPVTLDDAVQFLNENAPDEAVSSLLVAAKKHAIKLGIAAEGEDGALTALPTTIKDAERFRRAVGNATDYEPTNIRNSAMIKASVDGATEGIAGPLYRDARRARENLANKWENRGVISDLVNNKRGMNDRKVVIEDVFKHIILDGDRAELGHMRRVLHAGGEEGAQAWKDLQGATVNWVKEQAFSNNATDMRGNTIMSSAKLEKAIDKLEKGNRLEFVFGKAGAEHMRDLVDLSKVIYTTPPGTVNTSNTASVLLAALTEAGVTGSMTGLPVPVLSALRLISVQVKNRRIQKRIDQALSRRGGPGTPPPPPAAPAPPPTLH